MRKSSLILFVITLQVFLACNNNKSDDNKIGGPKSTADSLIVEVMDDHDEAMAKYGKLQGLLKRIGEMLDSLNTGKIQQAGAELRNELDSTQKEIGEAIVAMDKWMEEFNMDSALDNLNQRAIYLRDEKLKVEKVKEAMLSSWKKADSLVNKRF
jgi:hypothetical protein